MKSLRKKLNYRSLGIWAVISKNLKTIFRSKSSTFAIVLGPLLVMLLVGLAFNNSSLFDINIGIYSGEYSELTQEILDQLADRGYIISNANSTLDCVIGVKSGEYNICAVFPDNMEVSNNATSNITFYVDPSRINIVDTIMFEINGEILKKSQNISLELTNTITDQLFATQDILGNSLNLLTEVTGNNRELQSTISISKNKATKVDLSVGYEAFEVDELKSSFEDLVAEYNISEPSANSVKQKISLTDLQIKYFISKATQAHNEMVEIANNLDGATSLMNVNVRNTNILNDDLGITASDIDNIVVTNPDSIVKPITIEIKAIATQKTHIGRFLPTFIILVILFVSVLLSSGLILGERTSSAYFRNTISTTPAYVFMVGAYLTSFIIVLLQLIIIAIGLNLIVGFNVNLLSSLLVPLLLTISMFILLGAVVGYFTNSQETANVVSLFIIVIALFFSNTILPLEAIPSYLKEIVLLNPFVVAEFAIKKMLVFGFVLEKVSNHVWALVTYNFVFLFLSYIGLRKAKKNIRER